MSPAEGADGDPPVTTLAAAPHRNRGEFEENGPPAPSPTPVLAVTKIDEAREKTRGLLAVMLFLLLAAAVLALMIRGLFLVATIKDITDIFGVLLAPLVGLVGAATGFYYGQGK